MSQLWSQLEFFRPGWRDFLQILIVAFRLCPQELEIFECGRELHLAAGWVHREDCAKANDNAAQRCQQQESLVCKIVGGHWGIHKRLGSGMQMRRTGADQQYMNTRPGGPDRYTYPRNV